MYSVQHQEMFVLKGSLFVVSCMKFWIHRRYPYCNTLKRIILKLFLISNFRRVLNVLRTRRKSEIMNTLPLWGGNCKTHLTNRKTPHQENQLLTSLTFLLRCTDHNTIHRFLQFHLRGASSQLCLLEPKGNNSIRI